MRKLKICFVWDWRSPLIQALTLKDGITAAVKELIDRGHEVRYFTVGSRTSVLDHDYFPMEFFKASAENPEFSQELVDAAKAFDPDVILCHADTTRPHAKPLYELGKPMALCFSGGDPFSLTWQYFNHFFVESQSYFDAYKERGFPVTKAFGTNEKLFRPVPGQQKEFETCNFSTFASWKRMPLYGEATAKQGMRSIACGWMYDTHEQWCYEEPMKDGVVCLPHIPSDALRYLYAASRTCVLTSQASGGSQRTCLEAMSCGIPVIAMSDSDKTSEYIRDAASMGLWVGEVVDPDPALIKQKIFEISLKPSQGREYVMKKWTAGHYASGIEEVLLKLCQN